MTDFHVDVVRIGKIETHPNADALDITYVHGGYPCIIKRDSFKEGDLAVYVPIDTTLPDRPEFSFLSPNDRRRLKAKKLRGVFSMGLIVPVPSDVPNVEGTDVAELMGIKKFEPKTAPPRSLGGECEADPENFTFHKYTDIEPLRRNGNILTESEEVVLTEKLHGSNYRVVWMDGRLWVGSRTQIKKRPENIDDSSPVWWRVVRDLDLEAKLSRKPGLIFFGEVFGPGVQDLTYGENKQTLRIFDVFDLSLGRYLDHDVAMDHATDIDLPVVPLLHRGPWTPETLIALSEGKTTLGNNSHCREGFVVKPTTERWDRRVGRVILKMVGSDYYTRKSDKD